MVSNGELDGKMVVRKLWFASGPATNYGCDLKLRVYIATLLEDRKLSKQVTLASWDKIVGASETAVDDVSVSEAQSTFSVNIEFEARTAYFLCVIPSIQLSIETSGLDFTPYFAYMGLRVTNLRIAPAIV
jgi:hypothetical protein